MKSIGIIPARYGSLRFPGKPLAMIQGKTLLQRTYENVANHPSLAHVVVATDDIRIIEHVSQFGGRAVLTSTGCISGTDRLAEAYSCNQDLNSDIIVNIQGDEPCLAEETIQKVIELLSSDESASMATAVTKITSEQEALNPSVVKCVFDKEGNALYFSRSLIPGNKSGTYNKDTAYYKHLGIYAYRPEFLLHYAKLDKTPLQHTEDLEQLKVLELGYRIKVAIVESDSFGVDTPEDIHNIEKILCKQNIYS